MDREKVYNAVLAQMGVLLLPPFSLTIPEISRDFKHWNDAQIQPAIYLVQEKEDALRKVGFPTKWTLKPMMWIYARKDGDTLGVQAINLILDGLDKAFSPAVFPAPPSDYVNHLGGIVDRCSISGTIEIDGGYLGDQAVARVPLEIITTSL